MAFAAVQLSETERAVYLYGHGTTETAKLGVCCVCGRTLTHPVSVELGIGPECGKHYWDWNRVGGYTKENIARLTKKIQEDIRVDSWIPKSQIKEVHDSNEQITIPSDHPILMRVREQKENHPSKAILARRKDTGEALLKIAFPFSYDVVQNVKTLEGRKYYPDYKVWSASVTRSNVEKLQMWGFYIDPQIKDFLHLQEVNVNDVGEVDIPSMKDKLYPFQKKGIAFLEKKNGRGLIADEMGLGKTIQALGWLELHQEKRPAVVIVPASLKLNWAREASKWLSVPDVEILSGTTSYPIKGSLIVINYDILSSWVDQLREILPKVLIIDECHYIKNSNTARTKAVKKLAKGIPHIIALSGTPIVNRPVEAYNAIRLVDPNIVPKFWDYAHRYCGARHNGYGWDFSGATNTEELHRRLTNTIMIRRKKEDVLHDLPDKSRTFVPMELSNKQEYLKAELNFVEFIRENKGSTAAERASNAQMLVEIEGLKQLAVQGKLEQAIDWIDNFLTVDGKLVVFTVHRFVIDTLMERFRDIAVKVDGSVSGVNRQKAVDDFQNNPNVRLFVGNIKAAGVGITLTAASNVAFLELPWTPGDLNQAEDRCHRIGQKNSVNIYYLLATNTIEEKIAELLDRKRKVLDQVLDGTLTEESNLITELINQYYND